MKEFLTKAEINEYLLEINDRLRDMDKHGEILMVGGAVLATVFNARESTRDIDAFFKPTAEIRQIIEDIANKHGLRKDWLNDGAKGFITPQMNQDVYIELSNLSVYNVDAESLLAMKLTSARYMSKDLPDSVFLMKALDIKNIDQLYDIVEKYTHKNQQTVESDFFIKRAFEKYQKDLEAEITEPSLQNDTSNSKKQDKTQNGTFSDRLKASTEKAHEQNAKALPINKLDKNS